MKTSKKIMSVVIAVAMLMSTIAAVASFSSSADAVVYKWPKTDVKGDTWKTEGSYGGSWGAGLTPIYGADDEGNAKITFKEKQLTGDYANAAQANLDFKTGDFAPVEGTTYYVDITNHTSAGWKVMTNWSGDSNTQMLPPNATSQVELMTGEDTTLAELVGKHGKINLTIQTTTWPSGALAADFMTISPIYVEGEAPEGPETTTAAEETTTVAEETTTVAEETTTAAEETTTVAEETTTAAEETTTVAEETTTVAEETTTVAEETTTEAPAAVIENDPEFPAEGNGTITIGDVAAKTGETVKVPVSIADNPGIQGGTLTFKYDPSVLEVVTDEDGNALVDDGIFAGNVTGPAADVDGIKVIRVNYGTANMKNTTENGVLFTLNFKVIGAEGATSAIAFTNANNDPVIDDNGSVVISTMGFKAAAVEVKGEEEVTTTEPVETETTTEAGETTTTVAGETTTTAANGDKATTTANAGNSDNGNNSSNGDVAPVDNGGSSTNGDDVDTGSAAAPIAAVALAAGAAFVAFKARKK